MSASAIYAGNPLSNTSTKTTSLLMKMEYLHLSMLSATLKGIQGKHRPFVGNKIIDSHDFVMVSLVLCLLYIAMISLKMIGQVGSDQTLRVLSWRQDSGNDQTLRVLSWRQDSWQWSYTESPFHIMPSLAYLHTVYHTYATFKFQSSMHSKADLQFILILQTLPRTVIIVIL